MTRINIEILLYECSYKFIVNNGFDQSSDEYKQINHLNTDKIYQ
jgi:hypothetical protein